MRGATPVVVVVAWERGVGNGTRSGEYWADTRLMWISANRTEAGSRTLEQAEKTSSASGGGPVLGWVFGFMVPMVLLGGCDIDLVVCGAVWLSVDWSEYMKFEYVQLTFWFLFRSAVCKYPVLRTERGLSETMFLMEHPQLERNESNLMKEPKPMYSSNELGIYTRTE